MSVNKQNQSEIEKEAAAKTAVSFVRDNDIVGLGTGSTAKFAIEELAKLVNNGLKIIGVASSIKTEELAVSLGIPMQELGKTSHIDISIDGADEFSETLDLIKGGGGALFREKIVASLSKNRIIVTDSSKKVEKLGAFKVPIEVIPTAYQYVVNELEKLNGIVNLRYKEGKIFISDNNNYIVDVDFGLIDKPQKLSESLNQIDGLLAHGLFVSLTSKIIMAKDGQLFTFSKD
ncbi:ribose-5-phosphate isomerase RpiA [Pedobacter frigiditerrae]|uniref:Ribose-5-phosphate isomerase A n=1 Tax=Pedobacter frigiditerrae TaxID=2530452 RepID=A0A4R0MYZ4_9SPHI|nr:ribose-5-phosphate isomerase RpiA [Pedobacter frigiditerrae]TCC92153.1 ribose-5-phosphate isomerase RpiA [Pedobacter frigiditerrae]